MRCESEGQLQAEEEKKKKDVEAKKQAKKQEKEDKKKVEPFQTPFISSVNMTLRLRVAWGAFVSDRVRCLHGSAVQPVGSLRAYLT